MSSESEKRPREKPARRRTLYRGDPGMWSWVLHRITGATIFFFLFVHVLDTALVRVSPEAYNEVVDTYKTPIVGLMEVGLVAAVLYHASTASGSSSSTSGSTARATNGSCCGGWPRSGWP